MLHLLKEIKYFIVALFVGCLFMLSHTALAQIVTESYGTDGDLQLGMIVMLDPKDSKKVKPLVGKNEAAMHGVVVSANDAILSFGGDDSAEQVYVATNGKQQVLVSTQNGPVVPGDIISISSIDGIGMKSDSTQSIVLGKALSSFDGSNSSGTMKLKTNKGQKTVSIGKVLVDISVSRNPLKESQSGLPMAAFLKKTGDALAGKPVSAVRVYISIGILIISAFIAGSIMYGGVRSSIIAIGRNPLAKASVVRGLVEVALIGIVIFLIGLFSVYLILKI